MSIDKSLHVVRGLVRNRSVMTRAERIEKLKMADRWQDGDSPFGLPKVRVVRMGVRKKKVKKEEETAEGQEGDSTEATPTSPSN